MKSDLYKPAIVVTSISPPNAVLTALAKGAIESDWRFIIAGDSKSPEAFNLAGCEYFSLDMQEEMDFGLAKSLPTGHYARKNIGYLVAFSGGSQVIVETDDDNYPLERFWSLPSRTVTGRVVSRAGWINPYSYFCQDHVWPRGLPLEQIQQLRQHPAGCRVSDSPVDSPVQQCLANGDTDVDAIYRLVDGTLVEFDDLAPLILEESVWAPFNSQSTIWFKDAFPLMYLPSTCTFRMTDIWRSFVAQRCMWECGWKLSIASPTVVQERNIHNLVNDMKQEIPGYLNNELIRTALEALSLVPGIENIPTNMKRCYRQLVEMELVHPEELQLLDLWVGDVRQVQDQR